MLQFMKPAFEQLIKFQALILELKAYCGAGIPCERSEVTWA